RALLAGEIEVAMVQADVALWARQGQGPFAGEPGERNILALASLYPERLQIVTRPGADITSVMDLRGKSISLDEVGSGTLAAMKIVLQAYGLSEKDLRPAYLKPEFTVESLATGRLDGFCLMSGVPAQAVTDVAERGIRLVPVDRHTAKAINAAHPYLVPGIIPDGAYPGVPETPTIEVNALLVVAGTMADDLAYDLTQDLWSERTLDLLDSAHVQGRFVTLDSALNGLSIPLHPGARQYYQDQGLIGEADPRP
ncbi:MAG: TAXI family TRAP transporter solute-binding subunit, partial [Deltaproteobacteria bacterium]|nr:TAXI family TRAP transporter solute-binding subunit [Deltaproteobacteria bacterium]